LIRRNSTTEDQATRRGRRGKKKTYHGGRGGQGGKEEGRGKKEIEKRKGVR
jgi:hypothetical protein